MKSTNPIVLLLMMVLTMLSLKSFSRETNLSKTITIKFENETLKTSIKRIEKETGIDFAYSNLNDLNKKISGEFIEQPLSEVLTKLFKNTKISFKEIAGKITLFETAEPEKKKPERATIHGYIIDAESGERLINASIYNPETYVGTISNNFGFYSYSALTGNVKLTITYMGYQSQTIEINLINDTTINFALTSISDELEEIIVTGTQHNRVEETQMSMVDMPIQKLKKVPSILGEADVLKVIQLLPGVQAGTEGTSGIYVRGGGPDQNLYLLDGVPVYNPSHLLGIFSVFNPDALKTVKLYKGAFPARFGGRLSSVVDVSMKDGNMKELHGDFSMGLLTSKIMLEGPIKKDQTSFMLSARRSYTDILAKPVFMITNKANNQDLNFSAYFHDFNLKLNHIFSDRSRLFMSAYYGKDQGNYSESYYNAWSYTEGNAYATRQSITSFGMGWGNAIASVRWNYMLSPKLFSNSTTTYSKYIFDTEFHDIYDDLKGKILSEYAYNYHSGIRDYSAKIDFDFYPTSKHAIKFGAQFMNHRFTPGVTTVLDANILGDSTRIEAVYGNQTIDGNEFDTFVEDDFKVNSKLSINAGIHLSAYAVEDTTYIHPQPRLSFRYKMNDDWSVKASYSRMVQHVHLLYNSGINLPTDIWVPVTKRYQPPVSDQLAIASVFNLKKDYCLTIEGFYKTMNNLVEYKEGAAFMNGSFDWEDKVEKGRGWSYGAEFLLEKTMGNTTGWIAYTWSKSERQFEKINFGKVFPSKYDRRHDFSLVLTHRFSDRFDVGGTWVFSTGNMATTAFSQYPRANVPTASNITIERMNVKYYEGRNNFRLPSYHRMDLGMNFHKEKKHGTRTWSISVYNAYNQMNAFLIYWKGERTDPYTVVYNNAVHSLSERKYLSKLCIMPMIPTISYSFKF